MVTSWWRECLQDLFKFQLRISRILLLKTSLRPIVYIYIYRTTSSPFLPFFFLSVFYAYGAKCDRTNYKFFFWALPYFPPFSRFFVLSLSQSLPPPPRTLSLRSNFSDFRSFTLFRSSASLLCPFFHRIVIPSRFASAISSQDRFLHSVEKHAAEKPRDGASLLRSKTPLA